MHSYSATSNRTSLLRNVGSLETVSASELHTTCMQHPRQARFIAAGPLTKQPATMAYRVVLVEDFDAEGQNGRYIVWRQQFPDWPSVHSVYFAEGDYFEGVNSIKAAITRFAERCANTAEYVLSCERD
jgi:hypothetical protein